jgi:hypothetical protein
MKQPPPLESKGCLFLSVLTLSRCDGREISVDIPVARESPTVVTADSPNISEVESVCVDVLLKVDTLLSSATPNKTMGDHTDLHEMTQVGLPCIYLSHSLDLSLSRPPSLSLSAGSERLFADLARSDQRGMGR